MDPILIFSKCTTNNIEELESSLGISSGVNYQSNLDYAFRMASLYGKLEIVQHTVRLGANIHSTNDDAVRWASRNGHLDVVKYLVDTGANFRAYNDYAICYASLNGYLNVVQYLVSVGADFRVDDDCPVSNAYRKGHFHVVEYLIILGAYHPDIVVNFGVVNNLYSKGLYDLVHKLIHNNNCTINDDKIEQFNNIQKSVDKIIDARKWNNIMLRKLTFADMYVQFNLY